MSPIALFGVTVLTTFFVLMIGIPLLLGLIGWLGVFTTIKEREAKVYVLFGKVIGVIDEPGLHFLPSKIGLSAFIFRWFGRCEKLDLRLDQQYLRSLPVNSEEGAPMGIGVWYEMVVSDPVAYLFKNNDPRGSLTANVSNATVRCLSNLRLADLLENRHSMSRMVREEVSPKSREWGYELGSVYIRKVHFRDAGMIRGIEEKVVNRLRQVTSAIRQDGANQVSIITSTAERQAAIEFAKAAVMRPRLVGAALEEISRDPEVSKGLFEILEVQQTIEGDADVVLIPPGLGVASQLLATGDEPMPKPVLADRPPPVLGQT